jgi:hypothetical protein
MADFSVSWKGLASYLVSILAANAAILIQLSGKPSPIVNILAAKTDSLVSKEAKPAV